MAERLEVKVIPRSSQEKVVKEETGKFKVYVHAAPEGGKANEVVVKLLAKHFSVAKRAVRIVRGKASRKKVIEVQK